MTSPTPQPNKVETKVTAATGVSLLAAVVLAVLTWVGDNPGLLSGLPDSVEGVLYLVLVPLMTFVGGYAAPHTPREGSSFSRGGVVETDGGEYGSSKYNG